MSKKLIEQIKFRTCRLLYKINLILFKHINKIDTAPIFKNKKFYDVIKTNFSDSELERIRSDFKIKNYIEKKFSFKYFLVQKDDRFLSEVDMSWGFSRRYYVNLINNKLGDKIKFFYGNGNYRFEHFWIWKTPKQSNNVNNEFHNDGDMFGAMKIMIYLNDVDEYGGPFAIKDKDGKIEKILGETGTAIIFDQTKCLHAGMPNLKEDRIVLVATLYPTLRKKINYENLKPINSLCELNPFTKLS